MLEEKNTNIEFYIQRIYTKDVSFEAPNPIKVFEQDWKPKITLDLNTTSNQIEDNIYEVVLRVTVTAMLGKDIAFLCEVHQAGIFSIFSIEHNQIAQWLGADCPNILFPYARECITSQVSRGTFPQLNLAPINFYALFIRHLQKDNINNINAVQDSS